MPDLKEPWFFASDLRPEAREREDASAQRPRFPATYTEYLSLFEAAGEDQVLGEATPTYLRSHVAAEAIASVQPAARIVAIFREPASLLRSLHLQWLQLHIETETDFMKALAAEERRREGSLTPAEGPRARMLLYSEFPRYVEQLRRYESLFAPKQMLVLIYEDFKRDNEQTIRRILRFLEVDDTVAIEPVTANPTFAVRSLRLERFVRKLQGGPMTKPLRTLITTVIPAQQRRRVIYPLRRRVIYRAPEPVDERSMLELRRGLRPEVQALSEHLGRDLVALWGYDSLG